MEVTRQNDPHTGINQPLTDLVGMIDDRRVDKQVGIGDMQVERMMHHDDNLLAGSCGIRSLLTNPVERPIGKTAILTGVDADDHESVHRFAAVGLRQAIKLCPRSVAIVGIEPGKLVQ